MNISYLEKMESEREIVYPFYLNSDDKWDRTVKEIDTLAKFETFVFQLLDDFSINPLDFYRIVKYLEEDLADYHKRTDFKLLVEVVESVLRILSLTIKLEDHKIEGARKDRMFAEKRDEEEKNLKEKEKEKEEVEEGEEEEAEKKTLMGALEMKNLKRK